MRIALILEGTYPYVMGGVSVWCDRLIRQLPEIEFALYAVPPGLRREPVWELPDNVVSIEPIAIEPSSIQKFNRYPKRSRQRFLEAYDGVLESMLRGPTSNEDEFLDALRDLFVACHDIPIDTGVHSSEAFDLTRSRWTDRDVGDRLDEMGDPSLYDVLQVTSSLSRFLRPLEVTPVGDVAHATANGLSSLSALAAKWTNGTPVLLTEHGVYLRERYLEAQLLDQPDRVKAFNLAFFRRLNNATLQMSDLVSPVSNYNRRWELETAAVGARVKTIHNGVDPEAFPQIDTEPEVPTVTWLGRVDPLKDVETLIKSFIWVHKEMPEARLRLFGPVPEGNEGYYADCLELIERYELGDVVTFEGPISPPAGAFVAGHVVVLSSISEGFPFTVLEAMMSGRATVSTDVGGVAEAVGDAGLLVAPMDPAMMAEALVQVLQDSELRRDLGTKARQRALAHFTVAEMGQQYVDAYESIVGTTEVARWDGVPAPAY